MMSTDIGSQFLSKYSVTDESNTFSHQAVSSQAVLYQAGARAIAPPSLKHS
ncbi:MAG: hypothetical protein VKL39_06750 [Leptolyngbyaceae bacterium]|nr:hypothetical protein [Leptolyngbyaceae bacterium]